MHRACSPNGARSLALVAVLLAVASQQALAKVLIVDAGGGGGSYATIQSAVDAAVAGDIVFVHPGLYVEEVVISSGGISVFGAGMNRTIVVPATSRPGIGGGSQLDNAAWVFRVRADNVSIGSMTIDGDNPNLPAPIDARGGIVTDYTVGTINALECRGVEVRNVAFRGIYAVSGSQHTFTDNKVSNVNTQALDSAGIMLIEAPGELSRNTVTNCSIGIAMQGPGGGGLILENTVSQSQIGILAQGCSFPTHLHQNTISACVQGVQCVGMNSLTQMTAQHISSFAFGIILYGGGHGAYLIDSNVLDGVDTPESVGLFISTDISLVASAEIHSKVSKNTFSHCETGVMLSEKAGGPTPPLDVVLSGNIADSNLFIGNASFNLFLQGCDDNVNAQGNNWSFITAPAIEQTIWHQVDDPTLGLVDFSNAVTLHAVVDDDGPADFASLNPAIQALAPGGTIEIKPGRYVEDVVVDRSVTITGAGPSEDPTQGTILLGASNTDQTKVVFVTGDDVTIQKLRIAGTQSTNGRALWGVFGMAVNDLTIQDCVIQTTTLGVAVVDSGNCSFWRNELFDFGTDDQSGAGIFLSHSTGVVGRDGDGNFLHDGKAGAVVLYDRSSGEVEGNRVGHSTVGYVAYGCSSLTEFRNNQAAFVDVPFQAIANVAPVNYLKNVILTCASGFSLYGVGGALHTYIDNHIDTNSNGSAGFFASTTSPIGDGDCRFVMRGSTFTESDYGIVLNETPTSAGYKIDADISAHGDASWITGDFVQEIALVGCNDNVSAKENYFGTEDPAKVENKILHKNDDPALGLVNFSGLVSDDCELRVRGHFQYGYRTTLALKGPAGGTYVFFVSPGTGVLPTPYGDFLLDPANFTIMRAGTIGSRGMYVFSAMIPVDLPPGTPYYFQGFVGFGQTGRFSNLQTLVAP